MTFFSTTPGIKFILFGPLYFALLIGVVLITFLMYKFRFKLRKTKHKKFFRYLFAGILFTNMTIYYADLIIRGKYNIKYHLPLEFCFITGYILMYILVTNNKKNYFSTLFYCTLIGPLPAMILPEISQSYDRFIFYQFVISHHFMLLVSFYCIIVLQYNVETKSALKAFLYGNVVFISVSILNNVWGSNYIMQQKLPNHIIRLFPFVAHFNHPAIWLELCGSLMLIPGIRLQKAFQKDKKSIPNIKGIQFNKA